MGRDFWWTYKYLHWGPLIQYVRGLQARATRGERDPKVEREAPLLSCGFPKETHTAQVEVFHFPIRNVIFLPPSFTGSITNR